MSILRFKKGKKNPYFVMHNSSVNDQRLSWKAKGLLAYLVSKPDYWYVNYKDLVSASTDGITSVRSTLRELQKAGYLIKSQLRHDDGKFGYYDIMIFEQPQSFKSFKNSIAPHAGKRHTVTPSTGNGTLINTDIKTITERKRKTTTTGGNSNIDDEAALRLQKQKNAVLSLFSDLHIVRYSKILSSYPLNDIFNYCLWLRDVHQKIKNPTGFLITALKEKWLDTPDETSEHISDKLHWYKCPRCGKIAGYYEEIKNFTICFKCKNKE